MTTINQSLLRSTLEATQDGILAINKKGNITVYNETFITLWNIPKNFLDMEKVSVLFNKLADQVEDAVFFMAIMNNLIQNPGNESSHEWKLKTGKIFGVYTHPQYLREKIIGTVFSFRDVTEQKNSEEQLLYQTTHDSLTGLPSRILLIDRIQQIIAQAKRRKSHVAILLFDINHFKEVNDSLGRDVGDKLLKVVATKLKTYVRESDTVSRLERDKFVVVLSFWPQDEDISKKLNVLLDIFLETFEVENHKLNITVNAGLSVYPKDGDNCETLLKNADTALYHAKKTGRNKSQFYMPEFNKPIIDREKLTSELREALKNKEFIIHYQPLIDLNSGIIRGLEALLRWNHPIQGLLAPNNFIPLAEEAGLMTPIGEWVLKTACSKTKIWEQSICPGLHVAVNISGYQFRQKNFVEIVRSILKEVGFKPDCLELEFRENLILGNALEVSQKLFELKKMGVHLSVDDFGTGYTSLSYIKYFPFDKIKIDRSFISGITTNTEDRSIVEAIISMTKTIGLEVLAEGVENLEQVEFLRKHHSNQVQGYYFDRPLDEKLCEELLQKQADAGVKKKISGSSSS